MGVKTEVREGRNPKEQADNLEYALRKWKKACDSADVTKDFRKHEFYEKPSEKRKRRQLRERIESQRAMREQARIAEEGW